MSSSAASAEDLAADPDDLTGGSEPVDPPLPEIDERRSRRRFALIGLASVALIATVSSIAIVREQQDSLAVFDRAPTEEDAPPSRSSHQLDVSAVRLLGEVEGYQIFGYLGPIEHPFDDAPDEEQVCLIVTSEQTGGTMCTTREEFRVNGISVENEVLPSAADGAQRRVSFAWGPMGGLRQDIHTLPPRESLEDLLENEPTDRDREGLRHMLNPEQIETETMRWITDYRDLGIWVYQPDDARLCLLVGQRNSIVGDVASDCATLEAFAESGFTIDWPADGLQFTLSPELRLTVRGLP